MPDPAFPGGFKATATRAIPADATGSGSALIEGRPTVDVDGNGTRERIPVASAGKAFAITDAAPVPYRQVVDIAKCNDCHKQLTLHGDSRTGNAELCATCHNPNATDINRRVAGSSCETVTGTLDDQSIDFKFMVHAIHAGAIANYKVCGYNNTGYDFSHVTYPGQAEQLRGLPPARTRTTRRMRRRRSRRRSMRRRRANPDRSTPLGDTAMSPATTVCSTCHTSGAARNHMLNAAAVRSTRSRMRTARRRARRSRPARPATARAAART